MAKKRPHGKRTCRAWTPRDQTILEHALKDGRIWMQDLCDCLDRTHTLLTKYGRWAGYDTTRGRGMPRRTKDEAARAKLLVQSIVDAVDAGDVELIPAQRDFRRRPPKPPEPEQAEADRPSASALLRTENARRHDRYMRQLVAAAAPAPWE